MSTSGVSLADRRRAARREGQTCPICTLMYHEVARCCIAARYPEYAETVEEHAAKAMPQVIGKIPWPEMMLKYVPIRQPVNWFPCATGETWA